MKHCLVKQEGRLYVIGAAHYESLVDLVQYYEKTPLYNKVENIILHICTYRYTFRYKDMYIKHC